MLFLSIFLSGVGGSANWIAFLLPFLLLLIIIKTGEWLNKWIHNYVIPKFFTKKNKETTDSHLEDNKSFSFS